MEEKMTVQIYGVTSTPFFSGSIVILFDKDTKFNSPAI